ncbi:putative glutamine amidotransferase [Friedmanniella endophytica]|uniref:Putative glutamine amidotransferase n=1 Tax=Microlunatus kandeliicorticis TaxID=1759536 RepID=A0A7W3P505_9ACTN|nr:gamma-glutamyl-gamma-aminobutyrate hydrolase family protein [Microlunatus kandeliicorticis]MBA8793347.1 putative glutamine amidotransferase [Microlunatus kandeliicorticis]
METVVGRPVIGISLYREQAHWGVWSEEADLLPADYTRSVELAGGIPVLLPPAGLVAGDGGGDGADAARTVVDRLDAVIISGGGDISPQRYGATPHPRTGGVHDERDSWELRLLDAAAARGVPILGICRGMQALAVWAGGSLTQHLPDTVGHEQHSPGGDAFGELPVRTEPGSLLRRLVGAELPSHCHHHQAVADHPGFVVSARSQDGVIEAIEDPSRPFRLGVQWHPEKLADLGLFAGLVEAAREPGQAGGVSGAGR